jgi:hypothetical protein
MHRIAALLLGAALVLLIASQLALPAIAEREVVSRLERNGGTAKASLGAFPALRLFFDDGDSLEVEGAGLELEPGRGGEALERLDGFDEVRISLEQLRAGPLDVRSFELVRGEGDDAYRLRMQGETSAVEVGRFLGTRAGGPFGGALGEIAAGSLPGGAATLPVDLEAAVDSRDGRIDVDRARGSVAGLPAGPLAEIAIDAVARRL